MYKKYSIFFFIFFIAFSKPVFASDIFPLEVVLTAGMSGRNVTLLQRFLSEKGFYPKDKITGYFGPITKNAVWYFQKFSGVPATGIVGRQTSQIIHESLQIAALSITSGTRPLIATTTVSIISSSTPQVSTSLVTTTVPHYRIEDRPVYDLRQMAFLIQSLINTKRVEFGLGTISWNEQLVDVPLDHSRDQADDNVTLTQQNLVCHYLIIRHEGFTYAGYSLKDRLASRNIRYRYAGENIAMIPASKNLLYLNPVGNEIQVCDKVAKFEPGDGTEEDRVQLFREIIQKSKNALKNLTPITWVNKEWRTEKEIAELTVDGWMNSPGHRDNILRKEYSTAAIGIVAVNDYLIITHNFLGY